MTDTNQSDDEVKAFSVGHADVGDRLDRVCARHCPDQSRSGLQALIKSEQVEVNGLTVTRPRHPVGEGDRVHIRIPAVTSTEPGPEPIPIAVLFEDDHLIVIDKPAGLVVHPGAGNESGTLVNALLHHCDGNLSRAGDSDRPGIVHRLDKETSGCLVAAKTDDAYHSLVGQFSGREIGKTYLCVVQGCPDPPKGRLENRIGRHPVSRQRMAVLEEPAGKIAITDYEVVEAAPDLTWAAVRCDIHTGRTHQIRVHMKESLRCPIIGDDIYAQPKRQPVKTGRLMLHAWKLGLTHPGNGERLRFESPLPRKFAPFLGESDL